MEYFVTYDYVTPRGQDKYQCVELEEDGKIINILNMENMLVVLNNLNVLFIIW